MSSQKSQTSQPECGSKCSSTSGSLAKPEKPVSTGPSGLGMLAMIGLLIPIVIAFEVLVGGMVAGAVNLAAAGRDLTITHFALFWMGVATLAKIVLTILPLQRKPDWEYQAYFVGLLHNCFCVYTGLFQIDWVGRIPSGFNDPTTDAQRFLFRAVAGYFAFDAVYLFVVEMLIQRKRFFKSSWMYFTLHHPVSVIGFWAMCQQANCGLMIAFLLPFMEWSGVCLNFTWILRYHGMNKAHQSLDVALKAIGALLFTIGRMGVLNYVLYHYCLSEHNWFAVKMIGGMLALLSFYWEYKLVLFVMKAASPKTGKPAVPPKPAVSSENKKRTARRKEE